MRFQKSTKTHQRLGLLCRTTALLVFLSMGACSLSLKIGALSDGCSDGMVECDGKCVTEGECKDDQLCDGLACDAECSVDTVQTDCQEGEECLDGVCKTIDETPECTVETAATDCQEGEECLDGVCEIAVPECTMETVETDCEGGEECVDGSCQVAACKPEIEFVYVPDGVMPTAVQLAGTFTEWMPTIDLVKEGEVWKVSVPFDTFGAVGSYEYRFVVTHAEGKEWFFDTNNVRVNDSATNSLVQIDCSGLVPHSCAGDCDACNTSCAVSAYEAKTGWFDRDDPTQGQDNEELINFPVCTNPSRLEARTTDSYEPYYTAGDRVHANTLEGFVCNNEEQDSGSCQDYQVRFYCPSLGATWSEWYNQDDPSGADENEKRGNFSVCGNPIAFQARTISLHVPFYETGDSLVASATDGLFCINADQADGTCEDYEIRFLCSDPSGGWSEWFDSDDPSGALDEEMREKFNTVCSQPLAIEAHTTSGQDYRSTGDFVRIDPAFGFICENALQPDGVCEDYRVRFWCP